jgi:hypothetical protein
MLKIQLLFNKSITFFLKKFFWDLDFFSHFFPGGDLIFR